MARFLLLFGWHKFCEHRQLGHFEIGHLLGEGHIRNPIVNATVPSADSRPLGWSFNHQNRVSIAFPKKYLKIDTHLCVWRVATFSDRGWSNGHTRPFGSMESMKERRSRLCLVSYEICHCVFEGTLLTLCLNGNWKEHSNCVGPFQFRRFTFEDSRRSTNQQGAETAIRVCCRTDIV